MGHTLFGFRQPLGGAGAVRSLAKDGEIAFPVGLVCDPFSIGRPDRKAIGAAHSELPRGTGPAQLIYPHVRLFASIASKRDTFAIRGHTREPVGPQRNFQWLEVTFAIHQCQNLLYTCWTERRWDVDQRSTIGETEL